VNQPAVETIIWDLDGTIIDSFGLYCDVMAEILPGHGIALPTQDVLAANYHGSLDDSVSQALGGTLAKDQIAQIVIDFLAAQSPLYETVEHHIFSDALALARVGRAVGINQVVVTNRSHAGRLKASPRSIVERTALKPLIDKIICGDDTPYKKPDVRVLAGVEFNPETTLVIGDQPVDLELAQNIGARAVLVWRSDEPHAHTDALKRYPNVQIVSSLTQILPVG